MSINTKCITNMLLSSAGFTTIGALCGAVGTSLLVESGHESYNLNDVVRAAALGNACLGIVSGAVRHYIFSKDQSSLAENQNFFSTFSFSRILAELNIATLLTFVGGTIGNLMLSTLLTLSTGKTAAACAVGSGFTLGFELLLGCLCSCVSYFHNHNAVSAPERETTTVAQSYYPLITLSEP